MAGRCGCGKGGAKPELSQRQLAFPAHMGKGEGGGPGVPPSRDRLLEPRAVGAMEARVPRVPAWVPAGACLSEAADPATDEEPEWPTTFPKNS